MTCNLASSRCYGSLERCVECGARVCETHRFHHDGEGRLTPWSVTCFECAPVACEICHDDNCCVETRCSHCDKAVCSGCVETRDGLDYCPEHAVRSIGRDLGWFERRMLLTDICWGLS
jgi:hypothetical protein